jgi:hypothetical protein
MESREVLAAIGSSAFLLALLIAGVRLLLLWRRTRQLPELACGAGLTLLAGLGVPLTIVSGLGRVPVGELKIGLAVAAFVVFAFAYGGLFLFTKSVFRADSGWAGTLTVGMICLVLAIAVGSHRIWTVAPAAADSAVVAFEWLILIRLVSFVWYMWNATEGLGEYRRARRRQELGLSDPVVVNRFLLWGAMGTLAAVECCFSTVMQYQGLNPLTDPVATVFLASNGVIVGSLLLLSFFPPRAYQDFIRARSGAAPT